MTVSQVSSGGGRLAVEVEGDGPLVVCSPGLGDTRDAYGPLSAHLAAAGFRVASVDLRGHGDSAAEFDAYGDEATADDYLAVIDTLGGGPAVLVGASMSAAAATIAAGRRPDKIAGLVLMGPFLRNGLSGTMRSVLHFALARPWGPAIWRPQAAKLWPGLGVSAKSRAAETTEKLTRPGRWPAFRATATTDHSVVAPWIDKVQAPVMVVIGDSDPDWKDPVAEAKWVASNFSGAELLVVPGVGHAPMLEAPNVVSPAVVGFLSSIGYRETAKVGVA